jgi:DUF1009 family protein
VAAEGKLTRRGLDSREQKDVDFGRPIAHKIALMDIGQTIVVRDRAVVAVEAMEGTDAVIHRAGDLVRRKNLTVIKVSKPQQDLRFDVPAAGPETVRVCAEAGIAVLAVEAGKTLLLEKHELLREADAAGLSVVGVETGAAPVDLPK